MCCYYSTLLIRAFQWLILLKFIYFWREFSLSKWIFIYVGTKNEIQIALNFSIGYQMFQCVWRPIQINLHFHMFKAIHDLYTIHVSKCIEFNGKLIKIFFVWKYRHFWLRWTFIGIRIEALINFFFGILNLFLVYEFCNFLFLIGY